MNNPVAPYGRQLPTVYLFIADIANPDLFVCGCRISLDITGFPKNGKSGSYYWRWDVLIQFAQQFVTALKYKHIK